MAEIVGLIASIAGLIHITTQVAVGTHGYIHAVKDARKDIARLTAELQALQMVLTQLHQQLGPVPALDLPLRACSSDIGAIQSLLKPNVVRGVIRRLMWPMKEKEISQVVLQIERHKSLFILALTADHLAISRAIETVSRDTNRTANEILKYTQTAHIASRVEITYSITTAGEKRMKVLTWLYPHSVDAKHIEISGGRQKDTGLWLSRDPIFQMWSKDNPDFRILWGYGIPGAGKTYLSSITIDQLVNRAQATNAAVAHIYFNYQEQDQQTPTHILGSLIKQLNCQASHLDLSQTLETLYNKLYPAEKRPTAPELEDVLLSMLKRFTRVYLVFDALDESDKLRQRKYMLPFFHRMAKHGVSIFITSRPYPQDIHHSLSVSAVGQIELLPHDEDIRVYLGARIEGDTHARMLIAGEFREEVISRLMKVSRGMFLLVHFCIEDLCKYITVRQVENALEAIETSSMETERPLDVTYSWIIQRVRTQHPSRSQLALRVLLWLAKTRRTLTVEELRMAVSMEPDQQELREQDMPDIGMILEVCYGLVIVDDITRSIRLAHYTIQQYLLKHVVPASADVDISIACMSLLSFKNLCSSSGSRDELDSFAKMYPLLPYAAGYLRYHLEMSDEAVTAEILLQFLNTSGALNIYENANSYFPGLENSIFIPTRLYAAIQFGHSIAVRHLLDHHSRYGLRSEELYMAIHAEKWLIVRLLLEHGPGSPDPTDLGASMALDAVVSIGNIEILKLLLENGAGVTALSVYTAVIGKKEAALEILIDHGAPIEEEVGGKTPLLDAAFRNCKGIVRCLVQHGAKLEHQDPLGCTALLIAASNGYGDIVQFLVQHGANIEHRSLSGQTALFIAASRGRGDIVQFLVQRGADLESRDNNGETPLFASACSGHESVFKLLLDSGADMEACDRYGRTPLRVMAQSRRWRAVDTLREQGALAEVVEEHAVITPPFQW